MSLCCLDLSNNRMTLTRKLAASIAGLARLEELVVADNLIGPFGAIALVQEGIVSRLTALDLSGNKIGDAGADAISSAICRARVKAVNLARNGLRNPNSLRRLDVPTLPTLESLELHGNFFERSFENTSTYVCSSLRHLDVSGVNLGGYDFERLAAAIESGHATGLETLRLGNNGAGVRSVVLVAGAVLNSGKVPALRELDLSRNATSDDFEARATTKGLTMRLAGFFASPTAPPMTTVALEHSLIVDNVALAIIDAMLKNEKMSRTLTRVSLAGNCLSSAGLLSIANALAVFAVPGIRALDCLDMSRNPLWVRPHDLVFMDNALRILHKAGVSAILEHSDMLLASPRIDRVCLWRAVKHSIRRWSPRSHRMIA